MNKNKNYNTQDIHDMQLATVERMARKVNEYLKEHKNYCVERMAVAESARLWDEECYAYVDQPALVIVYRPELYVCNVYVSSSDICKIGFNVERLLEEVEV